MEEKGLLWKSKCKIQNWCRKGRNKIKYICRFMRLGITRSKLVIRDSSKTTNEYKDLGPSDEAKFVAEYFNALDWAFNNKNVYNIALTGPYGSGKSSIIKSYIKKHPELKYVQISLANFIEVNEEEAALGDSKTVKFEGVELDDKLELDILKQLFYKVEYKKIPQSRYRKLYKISCVKIFMAVLGVLSIIVICLSFWIPQIWERIEVLVGNASKNLKFSTEWTYILGASVILIGTWLISKCIYHILSKITIAKVNVANTEIVAANNETKNTIFNKNMDEIIYFFEETKYNVVFIEDLDRFKSTSIFIKLRELNTILNNYEAIKKKVVFVYAIKDDFFTNEERTKFFEFILPVIPIINATNSDEMLVKRIQEEKTSDITLSNDYISLISPYINDMRLLHNIYNEFIVYKKTLQQQQELNLSDQLMFSMMIYKNIYPKDFAELQAEGGLIKEAFGYKKMYAKNKRNGLEKRKGEIVRLINAVEKDALKDLREVKAAMLCFMSNFKEPFYKFTDSRGGEISRELIMQDDFDLEGLRTQGMVYTYRGLYNQSTFSFDGCEAFSDSNDYIKRCHDIILKVPEEKEKLKKQIEDIQETIYKIGSMSLKDMINEYGVEDVLPSNIKDNKLLIFLLRNGFIDEKYTNYINYFHANRLTKEDMNFILSVRNYEAKMFNYQLTEKEQVIKRLLIHEFEQKEIYNFDLMDCLLSSDEYEEKRSRFIKQLADEEDRSWAFIEEYFDNSTDITKFIKFLCSYWYGMWDYISNNNILSKEHKDKYFIALCTCVDISDIIHLNKNNSVAKYFIQNPEILNRLGHIPEATAEEIIENCNVKFIAMPIEGIKEELLNWIFDNGHYIPTLEMLKSLFRFKYPEKEEALLVCNYTSIIEIGYTPLFELLHNNLETYVESIVLGLPTNTEESLAAVLSLIEKGISCDNAIKLIEKENVILDKLEKCSFEGLKKSSQMLKTVWEAWIKTKKLEGTWENVIDYWHWCGVDKTLQQYLESNIDQIVAKGYPEYTDPAMIEEIITSDLEDVCFRKFIKVAPKLQNLPDLEGIRIETLRIILEEHYFKFSEEFAMAVKDACPELYSLCIIMNINEVLSEPEKYILDEDVLRKVIEDEKINEEDKVYLISISGLEEYSKKIALFLRGILTNINKEMYEKAWNALETHERYELFLNQIAIFSNQEISQNLLHLAKEYQALGDRTRRHDERVKDTQYNRKLVKHLDEVNYLTSWSSEEKTYKDTKTHTVYVEKLLICRVKKAD